MDWTFNFDATAGTFGFANSLFQNPREDVEENLSDQWLEASIKPKLSGVYTLGSSAQIYGAVSAVGERTFASVPDLVGPDISSFKVEDLVDRLALRQVDRIERECRGSHTGPRALPSGPRPDSASTALRKAAAAAATGVMRGRPLNSPPSAAPLRDRTAPRCSISIAMNCRKATAKHACGAPTTSSA